MYELLLLLISCTIVAGVVPRLNMMALKDLKCVYPVLYASGLISIAVGAVGTVASLITKDLDYAQHTYILFLAGVAELLFAARLRPKLRRRRREIPKT